MPNGFRNSYQVYPSLADGARVGKDLASAGEFESWKMQTEGLMPVKSGVAWVLVTVVDAVARTARKPVAGVCAEAMEASGGKDCGGYEQDGAATEAGTF